MLKKIVHIEDKNRKNSDILNVIQIKPGIKVQKDSSKDALLTDFGKSTLKDRYLLPEEDYQGMFARVASYFSDNADHAQRPGRPGFRRLPSSVGWQAARCAHQTGTAATTYTSHVARVVHACMHAA